jgi:hypothetical protein
MVAPEFDALVLDLLMKVNRVDLGHAILQIGLIVEHLVGADVAHLDVIGQQPLVDGLGGMGHVALALEVGLLEKPGQRAAVVQVKVTHEQDVYCGDVHSIDEWQSVRAAQARVNAEIKLSRITN